MFELVDDADVGRPRDSQRHEEVDDAGGEKIVRIGGFWVAGECSRPKRINHVRPYEHRDVERQVVDPYAGDNSHSHAHFECGSARLLQTQESTEQLRSRI